MFNFLLILGIIYIIFRILVRIFASDNQPIDEWLEQQNNKKY